MHDNKLTATFFYTPIKPKAEAKLKAAIELSAQGFNYFIINMDRDKNWELKKAIYGYSLIFEGKSSPEMLMEGIKKYIVETVNYGVAPQDIHFLVSSGALLKADTQAILQAVRKNNFIPNEVSAENEAKYGFWATVPEEHRNSAFFVDIGSGNTNIAWLEAGKLKTLSTYGAKYYLENDKPIELIYNEVKQLVHNKIPIANREKCFIIGGVPYELAKPIRQDQEAYTVLHPPEIYLASPEKYDTTARKTQAGLNIYQAIKDATKTDPFIFYWDANFTIGYLLKLPY